MLGDIVESSSIIENMLPYLYFFMQIQIDMKVKKEDQFI